MNTAAIALSGMNAATLRLANSANNVANSTTTGQIVDGKRVGAYRPTDVVQSSVEPQGGVKATVEPRDPATAVSFSSATSNDPSAEPDTLAFPNVSLEEEAVGQVISTYTLSKPTSNRCKLTTKCWAVYWILRHNPTTAALALAPPLPYIRWA
jgi:flagellar basal-body rod protein FlgC